MSNLREHFEKYLVSYVETRAVFETHMSKLQSQVNMLEMFDKEELKPVVKTKIKDLLEHTLSYAFKV